MNPDRVRLPTASAAATRHAARELLRPHRWRVLGALGVLVGAAGVALVGPLALGRIVDDVTQHRGAGSITAPVVVLVIVALAQSLLGTAGAVLVARVGEPALADLRERVMERALDQPLEDLEQAGSGDLIARVGGDVDAVAEGVSDVLPTMASSILTIALTVVAWAALDWRFAVAGLCAAPIQWHTLRWYLGVSSPVYAADRVAESDQAQQLLDSIGGASTVRALRLSDSHVDRIRQRSLAATNFAFITTRMRTRFYGRLNVAEFVGLGLILVVGFALVRNGSVTVGAATAAALYFSRLFDPINALLIEVDDAQAAGAALARLVGVAELPELVEPARPAMPADASVALHGVTFGYHEGHNVLHGIDLELRAGERLALVGASGAGKTTVAKLVAGIHSPNVGTVTLGGATHSALGPSTVQRTVAMVTQEVHVFAGTVADDLRLAAPKATDDRLRAALETVGALSWVEALDDGLATVVGHGGHRLTPTQAQQLALARLSLVDAPIVILDEATAESGSAGARTLEAAADRVLDGRTALVVAHRLTQAAAADRIVVLADGRIVEQGTHAELLSCGGPYAELWSAWRTHRDDGAGTPRG